MASEKDLRDLFAGAEAPNTLDAGRVIRRSRARRLPRQVAAGSLGALALVGVTVLGVQVSQFSSPVSTAGGEAFDSPATAPELDMVKRAPADKINLCEGTLAEIAPSQYGLQLDVAFPETAATGTAPVEGSVRLTNTSDREVVGSTPLSPAITLSQDGAVLWHSNGPTAYALRMIDLAPGASLEYEASFTPVRCGVEDDAAESFRADLQPVAAGDYELSALIDFSADPSMDAGSSETQTPELDLVGGSVAPIRLE